LKIARRLIDQINRRQLTLGMLATDIVWPGMTEVMKSAGLDYLIVDMEHGPHSDEVVADTCAAGRYQDFPVLVRTVSTEYSVVRRAMDLGPCGLMFPCVEDAAQLDAVRDATRMPPRGRRRPGGRGNRWVSNIHSQTWKAEFEDDFIVLPQIESSRGLANLDAIASHEMTTAVAVGPYDLSADLQCCWQPDDPRLTSAIRKIRAAANRANKAVWMLGDGPALQRDGFTFIAIGEPVAMLRSAAGAIVAQLKGISSENSHRPPAAAEHG
jgi:2-keto-3-deoxy-L-rhamnonate aldolase RhmA